MHFTDGLKTPIHHEPKQEMCKKIPEREARYYEDDCKWCRNRKGAYNCVGNEIVDIFISSWEADDIKHDEMEERDDT